MSLTSQDLQAISDLIDQRLEIKFEQKLKPIRRELRKIKKTLDDTIVFFDREIISHGHRLDRLEDHLGLAKFVNP